MAGGWFAWVVSILIYVDFSIQKVSQNTDFSGLQRARGETEMIIAKHCFVLL